MLGTLAACTLAVMVCTVIADVMVYRKEIPHSIAEDFQDKPANFGGGFPSEGLKGLLVVGEPQDGCSPLAGHPTGTSYNGKWIVLIARYNCSFEVKVRNAQQAGYDCAIVHNVNSSDLETMSANNSSGILIPSVFVSDQAGELLADYYTYDTNNYYLVVNGEPPFDINTHLLLPFIIVVALCLLVMVIFMIVKCSNDRARARRHRLPSRSLKKIPTCKFSKGDPYDTCAICLDDYVDGDKLRVLPCAHAYHAVCIDPWLTQNRRVCPVCKRRVVAAGEPRVPNSDSDDDQQPLLDSEEPPAQGGTFTPQVENPFVRAGRFMSRFRSRVPQNTAPTEDNGEHNDANDENAREEESRPLVTPAVTSHSERRPHRHRRHRRRPHAHSSSPSPHPQPNPHHSINTEGRGEIGVAALPATPNLRTQPHVSL